MWIVVDPLLRRGNPHQFEHLDGARLGGLRRQLRVRQDRLDDLLADRVDRIERSHRFLEDHRHLAAAQAPAFVGGEAEDVAPLEQDRIGLDLAWWARHQAHHGERGHALAAAGLADQSDGAAAPDGEVDAVDRAEEAAVGMEVGAETADLEELFHQKE